jgi:hypothetical protein
MQVAVAGMAEGHDRQGEFARQRLHACDQFRDARTPAPPRLR